MENIFSYFCLRYRLFTILCFLFMVVIMLFGTPFKTVLREDAYVYLLKGFEITEGDWLPVRSHAIGWSMFLAFFLNLFSIESLFSGMILSRILSILVMGLAIFPLSGLASRLVDKKSAIIALLAFMLYPKLIIAGRGAYSEPLFFLLVISTMYFLANSNGNPFNIMIATILGSFSFYVRPNGIFMLGVLVLYVLYLAWRKQTNWISLLVIPSLFFLLSLPQLYTRYEAFGGAFHYGINSDYLASSFGQTTSSGSSSSFIDYLKTAGIAGYYKRFIEQGLFKILDGLYDLLGVVWSLLLVLGAARYLIWKRYERLDLPFIFIVVTVIGFIPIFKVYGNERHLLILLPFVFIISSKFLIDLAGSLRHGRNILASLLILLILAQAPLRSFEKGISISTPRVFDEWALWAAANLKGKTAIIEGGDLIAMNLPDTRIGGRDQFDLSAEDSGISMFRPCGYAKLENAMKAFKKMQVDYLMIDSENISRCHYLRDVYDPEWSQHFILIRSFSHAPNDTWIIKDMDIFKVVY
jgi:hypothetical protein